MNGQFLRIVGQRAQSAFPQLRHYSDAKIVARAYAEQGARALTGPDVHLFRGTLRATDHPMLGVIGRQLDHLALTTRKAPLETTHALTGRLVAAGLLAEAELLPEMPLVHELAATSHALEVTATARLSVGITWRRDWAAQGTFADQCLRWAYPDNHILYANGSIPAPFRSSFLETLQSLGQFQEARAETISRPAFQLAARNFLSILHDSGSFDRDEKLFLLRVIASTGIRQPHITVDVINNVHGFERYAQRMADDIFEDRHSCHAASQALLHLAPYLFQAEKTA